jgi:hypothetical protein
VFLDFFLKLDRMSLTVHKCEIGAGFVEDDDAMFTMDNVPSIALTSLMEYKMRYAVHAVVPSKARMDLTVLSSRIVMVSMHEDVYVSGLEEDARAAWMLRGMQRTVEPRVNRFGEVTRFGLRLPDEGGATRRVNLFVRMCPPHRVDIGMVKDTIVLRITRADGAVDYGLLSELTVAIGEEGDEA